MTPVLSGGMVYEYSQETSNYGLVTINDDGSAQLLSDYNSLQNQFNKLNVTLIEGVKAQNTTTTAPKCASSLLTSSTFASNFTIPDVPAGAQDLINNGISNPNNGKIISVSDTKVTQTVTDVNNNPISNLAITPLANDASNTPSGETTGSEANSTSSASPSASGTSTSTAASATSTKKSAGGKIEGSMVALVVMFGLGLVLV
jgi:hypothetical protein